MIFNVSSLTFKSLSAASKYSFGASNPKIKTVIQTKNNPEKQPQLRGHEQQQLFMSNQAKNFYYLHSKVRNPLALYNVFALLPSFITNHIAKLASDPKVTIASDQLFLPKIAQNSVPVYESFSQFSPILRTINRIVVGLPIFTLATAVMPYIAFTTLALHYFIYFKSSIGLATDRFVVKMELLPETEEIVFQKVTRTGGIKTSRVSVSDIEAVNPEVEPTKYQRDLVFERSIRSAIDIDMIFRVKSTGQILMFDREGVWHEEGINHELMP